MGEVSIDGTEHLINKRHPFIAVEQFLLFDTRTNFYDRSISCNALLLLFVARARVGIVRMPGLVLNPSPPLPPMSNPSTSPWTAWPDGSG